MSEKKSKSEAELKRLHKDELQALAKELNIDGHSDMKIEKLIDAIMAAQEVAMTSTDEAFDDPNNPPAENPESPANPESPESSESPANDPDPKDEAEIETESISEAASDDTSANLISVRSTHREAYADGGYRQVFRERHPDHPDGEAWIANNKVHQVARTEAVNRAIVVDKLLEEVPE